MGCHDCRSFCLRKIDFVWRKADRICQFAWFPSTIHTWVEPHNWVLARMFSFESSSRQWTWGCHTIHRLICWYSSWLSSRMADHRAFDTELSGTQAVGSDCSTDRCEQIVLAYLFRSSALNHRSLDWKWLETFTLVRCKGSSQCFLDIESLCWTLCSYWWQTKCALAQYEALSK